MPFHVSRRALRPGSSKKGAVEQEFDYRHSVVPAAGVTAATSNTTTAVGGLLSRDPDWLNGPKAGASPSGATGRAGKLLPPVTYSNEKPARASLLGPFPDVKPLRQVSDSKVQGDAGMQGGQHAGSTAAFSASADACAGAATAAAAEAAAVTADTSPQQQQQQQHMGEQQQWMHQGMQDRQPLQQEQHVRHDAWAVAMAEGEPPVVAVASTHSVPNASHAPEPSAAEPADPWSALEQHYRPSDMGTGASPSPDLGVQRSSRPSDEEVIDAGSDEDEGEQEVSSSRQNAAHYVDGRPEGREPARSGAAAKQAAVGPTAAAAQAPSLVPQPVQTKASLHEHSFSSSTKHGGWGEGELAAAGTIMLGEQAAVGGEHSRTAAAPGDDVFGQSSAADEVWGPQPGVSHSAAVLTAPYSAGAGLANDVVVEDVEDADVETELAATGALPDDLAAKLAQFEQMLPDDDE